MLDEQVCDKLFTLAKAYSEAILKFMPRVILNIIADIFLYAMSSWATAYMNALSSQIETTKCLMGKNWIDLLPFPAIPNATTVRKAYSTNYTDEQKKYGRNRVIAMLKKLLKQPCGVLLLDTNKLIFDDDKNFKKPINHVLQGLGFKKKLTLLYNEIVMYVHADQHVVLVHRPLCIASDPQTHVTDQKRTLRGLSCRSR